MVDAQYHRDYYHRTRERRNELRYVSQARRKTEARAYVNEIKDRPCMDCEGRFPPICMDFDHRNPSDKEIDISVAVCTGWSLQRIQREIDKCDIVCSNCHRIRTFLPDIAQFG